LDEVHTYHGMLGTDVACLLRRLREALHKSNPSGPTPLFVGTSATLQAGEEGDPKVGVARFFTQLAGQETPPEAVVTEVSNPPTMPAGLSLPPPPGIDEDELTAFDADDPAKIDAMVRKLAGIGSAFSDTGTPSPRRSCRPAKRPIPAAATGSCPPGTPKAAPRRSRASGGHSTPRRRGRNPWRPRWRGSRSTST
jgi:hypothetical protein